jgi:hypothetical protein
MQLPQETQRRANQAIMATALDKLIDRQFVVDRERVHGYDIVTMGCEWYKHLSILTTRPSLKGHDLCPLKDFCEYYRSVVPSTDKSDKFVIINVGSCHQRCSSFKVACVPARHNRTSNHHAATWVCATEDTVRGTVELCSSYREASSLLLFFYCCVYFVLFLFCSLCNCVCFYVCVCVVLSLFCVVINFVNDVNKVMRRIRKYFKKRGLIYCDYMLEKFRKYLALASGLIVELVFLLFVKVWNLLVMVWMLVSGQISLFDFVFWLMPWFIDLI